MPHIGVCTTEERLSPHILNITFNCTLTELRGTTQQQQQQGY